MRLRRKAWAEPEVLESNLFISDPRNFKGKWKEVFNNDNDICLELGCGKGRFISNIAKENPDKNFIAIDLKYEVLVYVKRKCDELNLINVRILFFDITYIDEIFDKGEISDMYLNFSTPWPKARHHKRRLTYPKFLSKYIEIMKKDAKIILKTDHEQFFIDSVGYLTNNNFDITYKTMDLHNEDRKNILTEYEEKFINKGMKIMHLVAEHKEERK